MIAIPNMSKPKNCRECRLRSYERGNEYVSSHHICHALCKGFNGRGFNGGRYINIDKEIHPNCPLIDIVTCGECKHWYSDADCGMACEFTNMKQPSDGFCNWGERRNDDI